MVTARILRCECSWKRYGGFRLVSGWLFQQRLGLCWGSVLGLVLLFGCVDQPLESGFHLFHHF